LALIDRWNGKWLWTLRDGLGGVPCDLLPIYLDEALPPALADLLIHGTGAGHGLTMVLRQPRRSAGDASCSENDRQSIVGILTVDNRPSGRPLEPRVVEWLAVFGQVLAQAIESVQLRQAEHEAHLAAKRHLAELSALVSGAQLLIGATTPEELVGAGTQDAISALQADIGWAFACSDRPSPNDLRPPPLSWIGLPPENAAKYVYAPLKSLIGGQAALRRAPVAISSPGAVPADMPEVHIPPDEAQSYLAVPMIAHNRLLGALTIATWSARVWQDAEISLLQALANQMAAGLEAAQLRAAATHAEAMKEADRLKGELLSTVSHELRTPLGTIKGFATALLEYDGSIAAEERQEFLQRISAAADHLRSLVDDLLEAGRLEAQGVRLERTPVDLTWLVGDTIQNMDSRLSKHRVIVRADRHIPPIHVDATRLRQVLHNLLDNAVKYSPDESVITLTIGWRGDSVAIAVTDQGIGIPVEHLSRVFERFHRVDSSLTRRIGGTGLGLAIARWIVEAHGGRIWAESAGENRGTTITLSLPLSATPLWTTARIASAR
jgi:signal transduction histidine kinase